MKITRSGLHGPLDHHSLVGQTVEPDKTREVEVFAKFSESTKIIEPGFESKKSLIGG